MLRFQRHESFVSMHLQTAEMIHLNGSHSTDFVAVLDGKTLTLSLAMCSRLSRRSKYARAMRLCGPNMTRILLTIIDTHSFCIADAQGFGPTQTTIFKDCMHSLATSND